MVTQLKGCLGKVHRPLVVNGKLVRQGRALVTASLQNYRVTFSVSNSAQVISIQQGTELIQKIIDDYNSRYGLAAIAAGKDPKEMTMQVDPFCSAVMIETAAYSQLADSERHDIRLQNSAEVAALLNGFVSEYTADYMDLFVYLLDRRISAQHMSTVIRSHFIAGLFQPLIVETAYIKSPLSYGENAWFYEMLRTFEEQLENSSDTYRKINLSCIASCDLSQVFGMPVVTELDRRVWWFMVTLTLLSISNMELSRTVQKAYGGWFQTMHDDLSLREMFTAITRTVRKARTSIRTT